MPCLLLLSMAIEVSSASMFVVEQGVYDWSSDAMILTRILLQTSYSRGSPCNMTYVPIVMANLQTFSSMHEPKIGMADCFHSYICPFTTRNSRFIDQASFKEWIKGSSCYFSNQFSDHHHRWKHSAHSDYPLLLASEMQSLKPVSA